MEFMEFTEINNPRKEDGDFGDHSCNKCNGKSPAYLKIDFNYVNLSIKLCKGCLLEGVDIIDETILLDCIRKGVK